MGNIIGIGSVSGNFAQSLSSLDVDNRLIYFTNNRINLAESQSSHHGMMRETS